MNTKNHNRFSHYWNILAKDSAVTHWEGILKNVAILGSGSLIAQVLMAIYAIFLARYLKPESYGVFTGTYTTVALSSVMFNWGLDTWLLRHATISERPHGLLGNVYILKGIFGVIWGIFLNLCLPLLGKEIFITPLITVSTIDIWFDGLFNANIATLNALKRNQWASSLLLISRSARLIFAIGLVIGGIRSPVIFALGRMLGTLLALVLSWTKAPPIFELKSLNETKKLWFASIPYGVSDILATIYLQADVTLLTIISGNKEAVGVYSPASSLINALFIIPAAGYSVIVPYLTVLNQDRIPRLKNLLKVIFAGFGLLGILLCSFVWLSSSLLVKTLLGTEYSITGQLLKILSPILMLKSLNFACASLLVAVGLQSKRIFPQGVSALVNVILNLLLIAPYGVWGVAYAYVISESLLLSGYLILVYKWFKINH